MFWDDATQMTRLGHDEESCYHTRTIKEDNLVTEETALIALNISDQFISIKINGMTSRFNQTSYLIIKLLSDKKDTLGISQELYFATFAVETRSRVQHKILGNSDLVKLQFGYRLNLNTWIWKNKYAYSLITRSMCRAL